MHLLHSLFFQASIFWRWLCKSVCVLVSKSTYDIVHCFRHPWHSTPCQAAQSFSVKPPEGHTYYGRVHCHGSSWRFVHFTNNQPTELVGCGLHQSLESNNRQDQQGDGMKHSQIRTTVPWGLLAVSEQMAQVSRTIAHTQNRHCPRGCRGGTYLSNSSVRLAVDAPFFEASASGNQLRTPKGHIFTYHIIDGYSLQMSTVYSVVRPFIHLPCNPLAPYVIGWKTKAPKIRTEPDVQWGV